MMYSVLLVSRLLLQVVAAVLAVLALIERTPISNEIALYLIAAFLALSLVAELGSNMLQQEAARKAENRHKESQRNIEAVRTEVERTAKPITEVSLAITFSLPLDLFPDYRDRVLGCLLEYNRLPSAEQKGGHIGLQGMSRGTLDNFSGLGWISFAHPLFPSLAEPKIRSALGIHVLEMAFYTTPIEPSEFQLSYLGVVSTGQPPTRPEPDLCIAEQFSKGAGWFLGVRFKRGRPTGYEMFTEWAPPRPSWHQNTDKVEFVAGLANTQLLINFGGINKQTAESRAAFELNSILLKINNRVGDICAKKATKHRTSIGHPFWELRLPLGAKNIFRENR